MTLIDFFELAKQASENVINKGCIGIAAFSQIANVTGRIQYG